MGTIDEKLTIEVDFGNTGTMKIAEEIWKAVKEFVQTDLSLPELPALKDPIITTELFSNEELSQRLDEIYATNEDRANQFVDIVRKKIIEMSRTSLEEAKEVLESLKSNENVDQKALEKTTKAVDRAIKAVDGVGSGQKKWDNFNKTFANTGEICQEVGAKIPGVTGEIIKGIGGISTNAAAMVNSIKMIDASVSTLEKSSVIIAAISVAIKAVSFITDILKANKEANEASAKANLEYADSIEEINRAATLDSFDTIFGNDGFGAFKANAAVANEELANIQASLDKILKGGLSSDMRSGWQKFWNSGKGNIHKLSYNDIFDDSGEFDGEKLRAWFQAYGDGLSDDHKKMVEGLLDDWDNYKDAMDAMKDYLSGIFSDTASTIADRMIDAFVKTGNAVTDLTDLTQDLARTLAKNYVVEYLIQNIFDEEFSQDMAESLKRGDISGATKLFNDKLAIAENWAETSGNKFLSGVYGLTGNSGQDNNANERATVSKGIAQASQESVDELNGRMTAMQSHTFSLMENTKILVDNSASMLERLCNIDFNTARLAYIEKDIRSVSACLSQMSIQGIRIAM